MQKKAEIIAAESLVIQNIRSAFRDIVLEDGIGLWEAQGLDDYADEKTILKLREKDERKNWDNIPYKDITDCQSSLSFFDAKGMRFCLPKFLLFDILGEQLYQGKEIFPPDVTFTLSYNSNDEYQRNRFSLFNRQQIECVIDFLEYKLQRFLIDYKENPTNCNSTIDNVYTDYDYIELNKAIIIWKKKID